VKDLLSGPYTDGLDQYGIGPPTYRGSLTVLAPDPPGSYGDEDLRSFVWEHLIDNGLFPEPDEDGGRNGYFLMMPQGTTYQNTGEEEDHVQRAVEFAIAGAVEAVADRLPGGGGYRCCAGEPRERRLRGDVAAV
jgi:hypothetical protein